MERKFTQIVMPYVGKTLRVLADGKGKTPGTVTGRTPENRLVSFEAPESVIGEFVRVKIERAEPFVLRGVLVD